VAFLGRREDFTTLVVFRYDRLARTFDVALRCIAFLLEAFRSHKRCFSLQLIPFSSDVLVAFSYSRAKFSSWLHTRGSHYT
jgi:hypothetical protein